MVTFTRSAIAVIGLVFAIAIVGGLTVMNRLYPPLTSAVRTAPKIDVMVPSADAWRPSTTPSSDDWMKNRPQPDADRGRSAFAKAEKERVEAAALPTNNSSDPSPAFKLATLHAGGHPSSETVARFQRALDTLEGYCPGVTSEQIANYVFKGHKLLLDKGHDRTSLLQLTEALVKMFREFEAGGGDIRSGYMKCDGAVALLVVGLN
jgi:hypothetical protein